MLSYMVNHTLWGSFVRVSGRPGYLCPAVATFLVFHVIDIYRYMLYVSIAFSVGYM